jgi:hypothetical protein
MSRRPFRIAVLTLGALVIVGLSAEAAVAGDSPSLLERVACHVCYLVDCLMN